MNVTGSTVSYGQEAMVASLGKRQQEAQGRAALELLQGAVQAVQSTTPAPSASGSLGTNIDIHV
ncbi:MAG: hypothetical protein ACRCRW_15570 [Aeromonadaceae bacterium]